MLGPASVFSDSWLFWSWLQRCPGSTYFTVSSIATTGFVNAALYNALSSLNFQFYYHVN